ncbi:anhydro-N-acetylmuramic acid kinase [Kiloniella sp. b19]|uniref:anhydro-N-acetylmuramic acid kinase n=1 Tax=Kiloniella sp. GXU_MW_B19 TaxID=3141326 RepID=UPI0031E0E746
MTAGHDTGKWLLGLMSGTSMDGIDAALIRSDGERVLECGESFFRPYSLPERERIEGCLLQKDRSLEAVRALEEEQTLWHVEAVEQLMQKAGLSASDIALIGFHGQTLWHNPADRETLQIGDGALLASRTGIAVVNDFRAADVARGGEGAPFAPAYHAALARSAGGGQETVAFLNIGGVSNVTLVRGELDDRMLAFDLGPGNALMDDWARAWTGQACDLDGEMAARGVVAQEVLSEALEHPFFRKSFPKSLDRNDFSLEFFASRIERSEDVMATLAAFTVKAIGAGEALLPEKPAKWFVTGGGRHNPVLMKTLSEELSGEVLPVEARGWNGDVLEAQAFAYLALRSRLGLPLSWPGTTAVPEACRGGVLHQPA